MAPLPPSPKAATIIPRLPLSKLNQTGALIGHDHHDLLIIFTSTLHLYNVRRSAMRIQLRLLSRPALFGFSLIVLLPATGCDQLKSLTGSDKQTAVAAIGVYGTPHMIAPGGSSTITVIVLDTRDKPYAGAAVTLTTTLGTLDQTSGQTDGSGTFVTTLRTSLTDRGSAIIRAEAGSIWYETTAVIVQ